MASGSVFTHWEDFNWGVAKRRSNSCRDDGILHPVGNDEERVVRDNDGPTFLSWKARGGTGACAPRS
ncbi:hypothetical protein SLE2022_363060 [Rubroshorea leprosula]